PAPATQLAEALLPARRGHHRLDAGNEPDGADLEPVGGEAALGEGVVDAPLGGIEAELFANLVDVDFETEPRLGRSVAPLGSAGRLVGKGATAAEPVAVDPVGHCLQRAGIDRKSTRL